MMKNKNSGSKTSKIRRSLRAVAKHFGIDKMIICEEKTELEKKTEEL